MLLNETDFHYKVINYIRKYYKNGILNAGSGQLQDTKYKRFDAFSKGYMSRQPDIIIVNLHKKYSGFYTELKTPKGNGILSDNPKNLLEKYKNNNYKILSNDYDELHREINNYVKDMRIKCKHCKRLFKSEKSLDNHNKWFHRHI